MRPESERSHDVLRAVRTNPLDPLFAPKSAAVVGATERDGSVGRAVMENLAQFPGRVFPINPKRSVVLERRAFPTIAAVPERVDLAVIVTPAPTVPGVVRECVDAGVRGAIIISAGFKEVGPYGVALEQEVLKEAHRGKMRIVGPNCLGVMSPHLSFNATFAASMARPGPVAFVSQSGALCTAILDWSFHQNVGFSAFVSIGSMLDVGWGDLIYYLGDDPQTKSIVCYMESVGDARKFLSAAREVALTKPIIVIKVGRSSAAAKAAASHTGSLTGSDEVLDAAFRRVGVLRVDRIHELFNLADVLSKQPRPRGPRLAIITNAGGPGALSTDELIGGGAQLAELSGHTRVALDELLPPHWSHGNPIDILGDADAERYARAVEILGHDTENDGLLVILTPQKMTEATKTAERITAFAKLGGKPILASWMGGREIERGEQLLNDAAIPVFRYPDTAARAFQHMWRYSDNLRALYETPTLIADSSATTSAKEALKVIHHAQQQRRTILTEVESKQILAAYGISTVVTSVAKTVEEAMVTAQKIGFPVVLKLYSETITHKTDVGGVQLNIRTAAGVCKAWSTIEKSCRQKVGAEHFLGCTVQSMVRLDGYELIIGSSVDSQFGPVLLFGSGGQLVEVFKDRALGLPPLNATLARRLIERTRVYAALKGVRGRKPIDLSALEQLLVRFAQLVVEQPRIAEIDINPLLASTERLLALDARVVLHSAEVADRDLPQPAIRPYPAQYITRLKLKDGTPVVIRPIRPEDEPLMQKFHQSLSEQTVYYRYFSLMRLEQRVAHERLIRICFIDYDREMALVVERHDPKNEPEIIGVGRLSKLHFGNEAEFALVVSDRWHRHGLGQRLLKMLVQIGRDERLDRITATILPDNTAMQHVARKTGFQTHHSSGDPEVVAEMRF
jgi:acetyltransferase